MKNWHARQAGSLRYVPTGDWKRVATNLCLLLFSALSSLSAIAQIADTRQAWQKLDAEPEVLVNAQGDPVP